MPPIVVNRSILDRIMSTYGTAYTFGVLSSMFWHHMNRYQFHHRFREEEEQFRRMGRPRPIRRWFRSQWAKMREMEIGYQFKLALYVAAGAAALSMLTRLGRRMNPRLPNPVASPRPPLGDTTLAFVAGSLCVNGPFFCYHLWERGLVRKWQETNEVPADDEAARKALFLAPALGKQ